MIQAGRFVDADFVTGLDTAVRVLFHVLFLSPKVIMTEVAFICKYYLSNSENKVGWIRKRAISNGKRYAFFTGKVFKSQMGSGQAAPGRPAHELGLAARKTESKSGIDTV
jgi:hypothetical protein